MDSVRQLDAKPAVARGVGATVLRTYGIGAQILKDLGLEAHARIERAEAAAGPRGVRSRGDRVRGWRRVSPKAILVHLHEELVPTISRR